MPRRSTDVIALSSRPRRTRTAERPMAPLHRGRASLPLVLAVTLLAGCGRSESSADSTTRHAPSEPSSPLRDTVRVRSGGSLLYMAIRGNRDGRAVLLFLHGGPGEGVNGLLTFEAYPGPLLERHYVLAYLEQRGVLRSTLGPDSLLTVAQHIADVEAVVGYLHGRFPDKKLVLVGHSWGGTLAVDYAIHHPQAPVAGLITIAGPVSLPRIDRVRWSRALAWAKRVGNDSAVTQLDAIGGPPYVRLEPILTLGRWSVRTEPFVKLDISLAKVLSTGGYTISGYRAADSAWTARELHIVRAMLPELSRLDLRAALPGVRLPLLAIAGDHDAFTPVDVELGDLANYGGPRQTVVFNDADHFLFVEQPTHLADVVETFVDGLARH